MAESIRWRESQWQMIISLLLVIVAILLFGAAFVRVAVWRGVLGGLALAVSLPLLMYPLKGLIWLTEHPEWLIGVAIAALFLAFWLKMREVERKDNDMARSWTMFAEAFENDFTPAEREKVVAIRAAGDAVAFRNACRQFINAAEKRKRTGFGPFREERRAKKANSSRDKPL